MYVNVMFIVWFVIKSSFVYYVIWGREIYYQCHLCEQQQVDLSFLLYREVREQHQLYIEHQSYLLH